MRMVPDGTTGVGIVQQQNSCFDVYLRGSLLHPIELPIKPSTTLIGVRLRPGVAFNLTGVVAHSMLNRRTPLRDYSTLRSAKRRWQSMLSIKAPRTSASRA